MRPLTNVKVDAQHEADGHLYLCVQGGQHLWLVSLGEIAIQTGPFQESGRAALSREAETSWRN